MMDWFEVLGRRLRKSHSTVQYRWFTRDALQFRWFACDGEDHLVYFSDDERLCIVIEHEPDGSWSGKDYAGDHWHCGKELVTGAPTAAACAARLAAYFRASAIEHPAPTAAA